jgi:hypothetical protein
VISRFTKNSTPPGLGQAKQATIYWLMSTWDPYQVTAIDACADAVSAVPADWQLTVMLASVEKGKSQKRIRTARTIRSRPCWWVPAVRLGAQSALGPLLPDGWIAPGS